MAGADKKVIELNATATVGAGSKTVVLTATGTSTGTVAGTAFGWNAWPINSIASAEGLPLQPWTAEAPKTVAFVEL